jgi:hypothetical protein
MNRKLKVYPTGDPHRGPRRPQIKITGLWLRKAGFEPHQIYTVTIHQPGVMTITTETARLAELREREIDEYNQRHRHYCEHGHPTPDHPDYERRCPECEFWERVDYEYDHWRDK